jgi:hypothetical protein
VQRSGLRYRSMADKAGAWLVQCVREDWEKDRQSREGLLGEGRTTAWPNGCRGSRTMEVGRKKQNVG